MNLYKCLVFSVLILIGCGDSKTNSTEEDTAEMVSLLQKINNEIDPVAFGFLNSKRAEHFKKMAETATDLKSQIKYSYAYALELVGNNENEKAILELTRIIDVMEDDTMIKSGEDVSIKLKSLLALAYMRLGESNNCIENGNRESCLIPIKGGGVYQLTKAVESAIRVYENILYRKKDDYESLWMLNLAYMTLGEYPEKVPEKWLIPASYFESDYELPEFPNISKSVGLNTMGLSGGIAVEDFNNDGLLDLMASSYGVNDQVRLFENDGNGKFIEKTEVAGLKGIVGGLNMQHADYNNDGWIDVFLLRGGWFQESGKMPNSLLRNNGDGTFSDVTISAGLLSYYPTQTAVWQDFNRDGQIDLLIGNEAQQGEKYPLELFMNNGDGTFTNKTKEAGLGSLFFYTKGITAGDVNNDGLADIYISVYKAENKLLINNGVIGKKAVSFRDVSISANVQEPFFSFPTWLWDYNNDGFLDIFSACYGDDVLDIRNAAHLAAINALGQKGGGYPVLLTNNHNGTFTNSSKAVGFEDAIFAMGSNFGDIDNDGFLDCYLGTGAPEFTAVVPNKLFRNNQGKVFQDVTTSANLGHIQKGHAVGFGDFDNDGDQDVFCVLGGAFEGDIFEDALFLNPIGNEKNWITLRLEGTKSNKSAIGAKVRVVYENGEGELKNIYRWIGTGGSFGGNSLQLEIGLDDAKMIKQLEINWPTRIDSKQVFQGIEVNKIVKIVEGKEEVTYLEIKRIVF